MSDALGRVFGEEGDKAYFFKGQVIKELEGSFRPKATSQDEDSRPQKRNSTKDIDDRVHLAFWIVTQLDACEVKAGSARKARLEALNGHENLLGRRGGRSIAPMAMGENGRQLRKA